MNNILKSIIYILALLLISNTIKAQEYFTISGYVKDKNTGEVLIGATVYEKTEYKGNITNGYGFYSISLPAGQYSVACSYMGYETSIFDINLQKNISKDIFLNDISLGLETVTISAELESGAKALNTNEFSTERLNMKDIRRLPTMFGEADVVKVVQLQSGVKTLGDGSSGMFVRGGSNDQNLLLIDEAPIYNPSHLFGLVSIFNPDALNHFELYKSNMPAQYGGRVSSVIDCKMKEGNMYNYDFSASISPFAATLSANGPIIKEKSSFFISGRRSYIDLAFSPGKVFEMVPMFYDLNVKVNSILSKKDRLFISFYNGKDRLESLDGFFNKWGNSSATVRWNHNITNKLFINTSFIISNYKNYMEFKDEDRSYKWLTGLKDMNFKFDMSYYLRPGNTLKLGAGSIYHKFIPGENTDTLQSIARIQAFEHFAYILNDITPIRWLGLSYGLRLSAFQNVGKATWFEYNEEYKAIKTNTNIKGVYNTYLCLEPRISANIKLNPNYSLKVAYARNAQYMQVLNNNSLSYTSLETWFPANPNIKPIIVDLASIGWFQNITKKYFLSLELYYKSYQNQIDYIDQARLINNTYIEGEIRHGTAQAYGIEINIKKEIGRLTGNISYTYSRAFRKIEDINKNKKYNSPFDIPHDLRITSNYKLNKNWNFNVAWIYMSGRPVTLPVGFYETHQYTTLTDYIPIYSDRNASRMPDYHRMDVVFNYTTNNTNRKVNWIVNFGVFNLYAKKNPIGYEFQKKLDGTNNISVYQYTLFTIIPNFSIKAMF